MRDEAAGSLRKATPHIHDRDPLFTDADNRLEFGGVKRVPIPAKRQSSPGELHPEALHRSAHDCPQSYVSFLGDPVARPHARRAPKGSPQVKKGGAQVGSRATAVKTKPATRMTPARTPTSARSKM
jgi:hypothetical protein